MRGSSRSEGGLYMPTHDNVILHTCNPCSALIRPILIWTKYTACLFYIVLVLLCHSPPCDGMDLSVTPDG